MLQGNTTFVFTRKVVDAPGGGNNDERYDCSFSSAPVTRMHWILDGQKAVGAHGHTRPHAAALCRRDDRQQVGLRVTEAICACPLRG
jgi:hypothetical protein